MSKPIWRYIDWSEVSWLAFVGLLFGSCMVDDCQKARLQESCQAARGDWQNGRCEFKDNK